MPDPKNLPVSPQEHLGGCLTRLFWMLLGNVVALMSALSIGGHHSSFLSPADAVFWCTVAALLVTRYVDIQRLQGRTAGGTRASMAHWRRYAGLVIGGSLCVWVLAHGAAYLTK